MKRYLTILCSLLLTATFGVYAEEPPEEPAEKPERRERPKPKVEVTIEGDPVLRLLPPEGIPAIDEPVMVPAAEATLSDEEPVIGVFDGKQARAYPTWVLDGHEIVNDRLSQLPIAATW